MTKDRLVKIAKTEGSYRTRARVKMTDEDFELALAFINGDISASGITRAKKFRHHSYYVNFIAQAIREGVRRQYFKVVRLR